MWRWIFLLIALTGCQSKRLDTQATNHESPQRLHLTSFTKRVIRYDCNGKPVSDKIERIADAIQTFRLPTSATPKETKIYNTTTNSRVGCFLHDTTFTIGNNSDPCGLRVKQGLNELHYGIFYCLNDCQTSEFTKESGKIYLHVEIEDQLIGGIEQIQSHCEDNPANIATDDERLLELSREFIEDYPFVVNQ